MFLQAKSLLLVKAKAIGRQLLLASGEEDRSKMQPDKHMGTITIYPAQRRVNIRNDLCGQNKGVKGAQYMPHFKSWMLQDCNIPSISKQPRFHMI